MANQGNIIFFHVEKEETTDFIVEVFETGRKKQTNKQKMHCQNIFFCISNLNSDRTPASVSLG